MQFIDVPQFRSRDAYSAAVDRMVDRLSKENGLLAIYQIGHVSTPGISDIDAVAVFADNTSCLVDPRAALPAEDHYLFIHNLYGVWLKDFIDSQRFSFFHNYVHLWGENLVGSMESVGAEDASLLKRHVALEYLIRMYIGATVENTYRIRKLRSFMLQAKALLYDCEFLGVTSGAFYDAVKVIIGRRNTWFAEQPRMEEIDQECAMLYRELAAFLGKILGEGGLYMNCPPPYRIASNLSVVAGQRLAYHHAGIRMPGVFARLGRRYFNLQHRLNRFQFELPLRLGALPGIIDSQFRWRSRMLETNMKSLPHFMALSSGLNLSS